MSVNTCGSSTGNVTFEYLDKLNAVTRLNVALPSGLRKTISEHATRFFGSNGRHFCYREESYKKLTIYDSVNDERAYLSVMSRLPLELLTADEKESFEIFGEVDNGILLNGGLLWTDTSFSCHQARTRGRIVSIWQITGEGIKSCESKLLKGRLASVEYLGYLQTGAWHIIKEKRRVDSQLGFIAYNVFNHQWHFFNQSDASVKDIFVTSHSICLVKLSSDVLFQVFKFQNSVKELSDKEASWTLDLQSGEHVLNVTEAVILIAKKAHQFTLRAIDIKDAKEKWQKNYDIQPNTYSFDSPQAAQRLILSESNQVFKMICLEDGTEMPLTLT